MEVRSCSVAIGRASGAGYQPGFARLPVASSVPRHILLISWTSC
jgi:hypothetical protein